MSFIITLAHRQKARNLALQETSRSAAGNGAAPGSSSGHTGGRQEAGSGQNSGADVAELRQQIARLEGAVKDLVGRIDTLEGAELHHAEPREPWSLVVV